LKLQESMPNLKVYTFETLYSNLFNKSEIVWVWLKINTY
jgi:hypothetical protein